MDDKNNVIAFQVEDILKQHRITQLDDTLYFFDEWDNPELLSSWERFPSDIDASDFCECCGNGWQHMGAELHDGVWLHCFRHRHYKGTREYIRVPATEGWVPPFNKGEK